VVLDPGHGGRDPGAIACNGLFEEDVVLPVALEVRRRLLERGVKVVMTRSDDRFVELDRRAEIADAAGADLFVSIHADWAPSRLANGHIAYVAGGPRRGRSRRPSASIGAWRERVFTPAGSEGPTTSCWCAPPARPC